MAENEMLSSPETAMPGGAASQGLSSEGAGEAAGVEPEQGEPEKPSKEWGGKFKTAEELEQDWHRQNQEKNELKAKLEGFKEGVSVKGASAGNSQENDPWEKEFQIQFQKDYALETESFGHLLDENAIHKRAEATANEKIADRKKLFKNEKELAELKKYADPDEQLLRNAAKEAPLIQKMIDDGADKKTVLMLIKSLSTLSPQAIPRPEPNRAAGGNGGSGSSAKAKSSPERERLIQRLKADGIKSEVAIASGLRKMGFE